MYFLETQKLQNDTDSRRYWKSEQGLKEAYSSSWKDMVKVLSFTQRGTNLLPGNPTTSISVYCTLSAIASLRQLWEAPHCYWLTMWEHPMQCPVFGSLGKTKDLTTHSAWVSETKETEDSKLGEVITYLSTQQKALGSLLETTGLWNLLWELYGSRSGEKLLHTPCLSLSLCSFSAREERKEKKAAAELGE